ncbi:hypothetical protein V8F06_011614 [Rhypophila decipiens]
MTAAAAGGHSFPERHFGSRDDSPEWIDSTDGMGCSNIEPTHWVESMEFVAPKMSTLEPSFSSSGPQTWMDQASLSFHRSQTYPNLKHPASVPPPPPPSHDIFASSIHETTSSTVHQTELDLLWGQGQPLRSPSDFVWVPHTAQTQQPTHAPSSRGEDDESDSILSLQDSLEDYFQPLPASWHPQPGQLPERFRRRSVPKVTKPGAIHPQALRHGHAAFSGGRRVTRAAGPTGIVTVTPTTSLNQQHEAGAHSAYHSRLSLSHKARTSQPLSDDNGADIDGEDDSSKQLSKKIAHKLSEKTRRNRLTMAIREIEKLLPPPASNGDDEAGDEAREDRIQFIPGGNAVSKVEVVEMAIGYIKRLQDENKKMARKVAKVEAKLVNIRRSKEESKEKNDTQITVVEEAEKDKEDEQKD